MKLGVFSDVHNEFGLWNPPETDCDAILLAGDIHTKRRGPLWASRAFPNKPVLMIGGNHETYGDSLFASISGNRTEARKTPNVAYLEREEYRFFDEVRVLGATLWTDFALYGITTQFSAQNTAQRMMNDFYQVTIKDRFEERPLVPEDTLKIHNLTVRWLKSELQRPFPGKTVVMTHHAPSAQSIDPRYRGDQLNPAFVSNLENLILKHEPDLWVHGHVHSRFDYHIGKTRIVCNPRGYVNYEETGFNPELVVEV